MHSQPLWNGGARPVPAMFFSIEMIASTGVSGLVSGPESYEFHQV